MLVCPLTEVIVITTKEVQKEVLKLDVKLKLDVVCIQEEADMGTAQGRSSSPHTILLHRATYPWAQRSCSHPPPHPPLPAQLPNQHLIWSALGKILFNKV